MARDHFWLVVEGPGGLAWGGEVWRRAWERGAERNRAASHLLCASVYLPVGAGRGPSPFPLCRDGACTPPFLGLLQPLCAPAWAGLWARHQEGSAGRKGRRSWVRRAQGCAQGRSLGSLGEPGGTLERGVVLRNLEEPGGAWGAWWYLGEPREPGGVENLEEPGVLGRPGSHSITSTPTGCLVLGKSI